MKRPERSTCGTWHNRPSLHSESSIVSVVIGEPSCCGQFRRILFIVAAVCDSGNLDSCLSGYLVCGCFNNREHIVHSHRSSLVRGHCRRRLPFGSQHCQVVRIESNRASGFVSTIIFHLIQYILCKERKQIGFYL